MDELLELERGLYDGLQEPDIGPAESAQRSSRYGGQEGQRFQSEGDKPANDITDEELLELAFSQPETAVSQKSRLGQGRDQAPAVPEITDDELLELAYSQADERPSCMLPGPTDEPMARVTLTLSPSAKRKRSSISLPPAPLQKDMQPSRADKYKGQYDHKSAQQPAPLATDITDEELLALAESSQPVDDAWHVSSAAAAVSGQAVISLPPMPGSKRPPPRFDDPSATHNRAQGAAPAVGRQLYADRPGTNANILDTDMAVDLDDDALPGRDWTLPALNPLDVDGNVISVIAEGLRVYCRLRSRIEDEPDAAEVMAGTRTGGLLAQPLAGLMRELEEQDFQIGLDASARMAAAADGENRPPNGCAQPAGPASKRRRKRRPKVLWVDKYSPHSYLDLLSNETINREVAQWLMTWRRYMDASSAAGGNAGRHGAPHSLHHGRRSAQPPEHKLLLLSGPPGLGKTTLAHIAARHCGFRPVEINASDERTASSLTARINDAVQMQAVIASKRPNCVIIDEIDGATGGVEGRSAIQALLKIVQAGPARGARPTRDNLQAAEDGAEPRGGADRGVQGSAQSGRGSRAPSKPLSRPLIAICNDLYAPALRPLRSVAKILPFKAAQADRLLERLQQICEEESLTADRQALAALCEGTQQDVRSCLNTLQFLARRCRHVRLGDVEGVAVGHKDSTRSAFSLWQRLLSYNVQQGGSPVTDPSAALYDHLLDFGDLDLICAGVHEHAWGLRYMDVHMKTSALVADRLRDADRLCSTAHRRSSFALLKYGPAKVLNVRRLVTGPGRLNLKWPRAQGEAQRGRTGNLAMLRSWLQETAPAVFTFLSLDSAVQEVLPALVAVLAQPQRVVARHLLTPEEVAVRRALVGTMLDYGVTFAVGAPLEAVAAEGPSDIVLSPPVHRLTSFEGQPSGRRKLALPVRQLLAHEATLQLIQRREQAMRAAEADQARPGQSSGMAASMLQREAASTEAAAAPHAPHLVLSVAQRAQGAGVTGAATKPAKRVDWLGQLRQKHEQKLSLACQAARQQADPAGGSQDGSAPPVLYKFHEGYTNAVKRPVMMKDLL